MSSTATMLTHFLNTFRRIKFFCTLGALAPFALLAQGAQDTNRVQLQPVEVKVHFMQQPQMSLTSSVHALNTQSLTRQSGNSFTSPINTVPGVRMEERSPGSYRIAMRGSMIRSPFGIRNTKIYMDEFPLTDAGGNTYFNLIDPAAVESILVNKGPDGSLYGANSGGVIRIAPKGYGDVQNGTAIQLIAGSFGLFNEQLSLQRKVTERYQFSLDQSFMRSDGYREQSALNKKTFQTAHQWQYHTRSQLRLFLLYADLRYQTPGGLTEAQYAENPKAARLPVGSVPGAKEQKAAIYNKTWIGGLSNQTQLTDRLTHHVSLFGSSTDFENPFITNYEYRQERNFGFRTYFSWNDEADAEIRWQTQLGTENHWGGSERTNYTNTGGVHGNLLDDDELRNYQLNIFYRTMVQFWDRWMIEGSLGYNWNTVHFEEIYPEIADPKGKIDFTGIWMPRVASSFQVNENIALRASLAKGYSTPTIEEIRPSDRIINTDLRPETGTNVEAGVRYSLPSQRLLIDFSAYRYNMDNGIVRQINELGEDYYRNAGAISQKGIELSLWSNILQAPSRAVVRQISLQSSGAYQHYRFGEYQVGDTEFSGNALTAVPAWTFSNSLQIGVASSIYLNVLHQYVSSMPLNDANTIYADAYHLLQAKLGFSVPSFRTTTLDVFLGADNILNQRYSLGNDINAFGGRYFNAAPTRNLYAGVRLAI